jgi:hypothetical protein
MQKENRHLQPQNKGGAGELPMWRSTNHWSVQGNNKISDLKK